MRRTHRRALGRILGVGLLAVSLASPALAVPSNKSQCRRITRQITHFEDVATMAAERGDEMWFDGTVDHIKRLGERRSRMCPEYDEPNYAAIYAEWAWWMIKRGAEAFRAYMTFGTF